MTMTTVAVNWTIIFSWLDSNREIKIGTKSPKYQSENLRESSFSIAPVVSISAVQCCGDDSKSCTTVHFRSEDFHVE